MGISPGAVWMETLRRWVEGVYSLQEWHIPSGVFRPPQVEGRFVLLNGAVVLITQDRSQEGRQRTVASYGSYILSADRFAYRYEDQSIFTETAAGISVLRRMPWEGRRSFDASREGEAVRLRACGGPQEFRFQTAGLTYSAENIVRIWRRVTGTP